MVDDHQIVLDGLMALLKDEQHEIVFSTTNPEEVESLVAQHKIDLLITDIMMPDITGKGNTKAFSAGENSCHFNEWSGCNDERND